MLFTPHSQGVGIGDNLGAASTTVPSADQMTAGTTFAKGAYVELEASTDQDVYGFYVGFSGSHTSGTDTSGLCDIAIGASSSEVVLVPNLLAGMAPTWTSSNNMFARGIHIPLFIPRGTRVSARWSCVTDSQTCDVGIFFNYGSNCPTPIYSGCDDIGTITSSDASATPVLSGTATMGSWIEIPSATTTSREYGAIGMMLMGEDDNNHGTQGGKVEAGIGSAAIDLRQTSRSSSNESVGFGPHHALFRKIPSGTQLQARAEYSSTARDNQVAFYGYY